MAPFRDLSINRKLRAIIMLTSGIAVLLACLAFLVYDRIAFKDAVVNNLKTLSDIIGENSTAALMFDNAQDASEILMSLSADRHILAAAIYNTRGQVFAMYHRDNVVFTPPEIRPPGHVFGADYLELFNPVILDTETIGTVFVRSDLEEMLARQNRYLFLVIAFLIFSFLVVLLITSRLQRIISHPILQLTKLARAVSVHRDYSVRAEKNSEDEVGVLIGAFNEMLTQIQNRDQALNRANEALESHVIERTRDLQAANEQLVREIEERKRAEQVLLEREEQLRQSQKMEAIGKLAGGVAHDFNNQLAIVQGYVDMVMSDVPEGSPARGRLMQISKAVERSSGLTQQLLMFSSKQPMQMRPINLNGHVGELKNMLERLMGEDIEVVLDLDNNLQIAHADPSNIDQVVTNLCVNARDAMAEGGTITIQTRMVEIDDMYCRQVSDARPGTFIRLSVSDRGTGMTANVLEHLFEPFFTTKGLGKGTGLGLSVVYGIMQSHEGWITVHSELGRGSRFDVFLKPIEEVAVLGNQTATEHAEDLAGHGERILLVEDEKALGEMTQLLLTERNYSVALCHSAMEARSVFAASDFDMILSDVMLPDGRGPDLVLDLMKQRPNVVALLVTGYTDERSDSDRVRAAGLTLLQKPVSIQVLLKNVRLALEARSSFSAER